jgi:hypothetical protein
MSDDGYTETEKYYGYIEPKMPFGYTEREWVDKPNPEAKLHKDFFKYLVKTRSEKIHQSSLTNSPARELYKNQMKYFVDFHKEYRKEMYDLVQNKIVKNITQGKKSIIVHAPVKSGKRGFVQLAKSIMCSDEFKYDKYTEHLFVTSLVRTADKSQMDEMDVFEINTHPISNTGSVHKLLYKLNARAYYLNSDMDKEDKEILDGIKKYEMKKKTKDNTVPVDYETCWPIVHIDESDYGTGNGGLMSKVWKFLTSSYFKGSVVLYSATPYETIIGIDPASNDYTHTLIEYTPPLGYCGAEKFLDKKLVVNAKPFFEFKNGGMTLSEQGCAIIDGAKKSIKKDPKRNIIILRVTTSKNLGTDGKDNEVIAKYINRTSGIDDTIVVFFHPDVDTDKTKKGKDRNKDGLRLGGFKDVGAKTKKIIWDENSKTSTSTLPGKEDDGWETVMDAFPVSDGIKIYILIIDQICARSTEIKFHDRIYAYHDYRNFETCAVSTMTQAQERVCHYATSYDGYFQPILVFGDVKAMIISTGKVSWKTAMKIVSHRVKDNKDRKRKVLTRFFEYTGKCLDTGEIDKNDVEGRENFINNVYKSVFEADFRSDLDIGGKIKKSFDKIVEKNYKKATKGEKKGEMGYILYERKWNYDDLSKRAEGLTNSTISSAFRTQPCYKNGKFGIMILWYHAGYKINKNDERLVLFYKDDSKKIKYDNELESAVLPTVKVVTDNCMYKNTFTG